MPILSKFNLAGTFGLLFLWTSTLMSEAILPIQNSSQYLKPISILDFPSKFSEDFVDTAVDYGPYWTSPFRWQDKEWGIFWNIIGITGALLLVDQPLFKSVEPKNFESINTPLKAFHDFGDWRYTSVFLSATYIGSYILQDTKLNRAARIATKSFLFQSLVNQGIKNIIYRTKIDDPYDFRATPPSWKVPSSGAFPSGHASNMWSTMSGFALAYKDDPVIPAVCYTSATIGSILLVTNDSHWISDIVLGAALGYYSAEYMTYIDDQRTGYTILPILGENGVGLSVNFN